MTSDYPTILCFTKTNYQHRLGALFSIWHWEKEKHQDKNSSSRESTSNLSLLRCGVMINTIFVTSLFFFLLCISPLILLYADNTADKLQGNVLSSLYMGSMCASSTVLLSMIAAGKSDITTLHSKWISTAGPIGPVDNLKDGVFLCPRSHRPQHAAVFSQKPMGRQLTFILEGVHYMQCSRLTFFTRSTVAPNIKF